MTDDKGLLIIHGASPEGDKKHQKAIEEIAKKITKLGKQEGRWLELRM